MNNMFLPHKDNDKIWQTQGSTKNLAIMLFDFNDEILDIEGYNITNVTVPYPMKLLVPRNSGLYETFVLVAPRSSEDLNGGFFITYINNSADLFVTTGVCTGEGCLKCSP